MNDKHYARRAVGNALIWAAMIIAWALLSAEGTGGQMLYLLIAGWLASQSLIGGAPSAGAECAALRRVLRRGG